MTKQSVFLSRIHFLTAVVILPLLLVGCIQAADEVSTKVSADEARQIAKEAYTYANPVVDSYRVLYSYFVDREDPEFKASWNQLVNVARTFTPEDKKIQTPNSDTPYGFLGMDLRAEPLVLTVPPMEKERYFTIQLIDLYTHIFDYIGTRTTGNSGGKFLIAGPGWKGKTPEGITKVIRTETELALAIYRTQLFNPDDLGKVKAIQTAYKAQPLSEFLGQAAPDKAPAIKFIKPLSREGIQKTTKVFEQLNFVLQFCPTHPSEKELMQRFAKLGIGAGKTFDIQKFSPDVKRAIEQGIIDSWAEFAEVKKLGDAGEIGSGDIFGSREQLANNYAYRMAGAATGIWGNIAEEAVYPTYWFDSQGESLSGAHQYQIKFAPDDLPPVDAFWSLTMYQMPESLLVANPLNRYLLNSTMLSDFVRDTDGGITLHFQHESPGKELEPNWLPAPEGPFIVILRLYLPKAEALDGKWKEPPLTRKDQSSTPEPVTIANFVRAETDHMFRVNMKMADADIGQLVHLREPTAPDNQPVIRMNQDTLYSGVFLDLSKPATITLPEVGGRYMSMQVVNQDHYMFVESKPGTYKLTEKEVGTRFTYVAIRTFYNAGEPDDLTKAHAAQDKIEMSGGGDGPFEAPNWDTAQLAVARKALNDLAALGFDSTYAFGRKEDVRPVDYLVGAAAGWGGLPSEAALYILGSVEENDGKAPHALTVKDVPVDAFWSITIYNADGYLEANDLGRNSFNSSSAKPNEDGSYTLHFGGDPKSANYLPITKGWNYAIRIYQPRKEILDGTWTFPAPQKAK
jgi:hypothetical protein